MITPGASSQQSFSSPYPKASVSNPLMPVFVSLAMPPQMLVAQGRVPFPAPLPMISASPPMAFSPVTQCSNGMKPRQVLPPMIHPDGRTGVLSLIPTPDEVNDKVNFRQGALVGAATGAVLGAVMSVPNFLLERTSKDDSTPALVNKLLPRSTTMEDIQQKPILHLGFTTARSVVSVSLLGGLLGLFLSGMVRDRVNAIAKANQESQKAQQQEPTNAVLKLYQSLGLIPKPVKNPQTDYEQLVNGDLRDRKQAFWDGFKKF